MMKIIKKGREVFSMNLLEYALLCASTLGFLYIIWSGSRFHPLTALLIVTSLLGILVLHMLIEQLRWLMLPVYGIVTIVVTGCMVRRRNHTSRQPNYLRSILLSLLAFLAGMLSWGLAILLPLFQFTEPSGPYDVGVVDYTLTDPDRTLADGANRQLNVRIWYPSSGEHTMPAHYIPQSDLFIKAVKKQHGLWSQLLRGYRRLEIPAQYAAPFYPNADPVPVVVYLHGNQIGTRFTGTFQAIELASHGYMVVALEHPGTAFLSVFDENNYTAFTHSFKGLADSFSAHNSVAIPIIREMQADAQFVLHYLQDIDRYEPNSLFTNRMDHNRIALVGHSFGGAAAAHILANTTTAKAAVNLDGYLYGEYPDEPQPKPLLILNGGLEIKGLEETMTGLEEERALRIRLLGNKGIEVTLPQAGHLSFTDLPLYSPLLKQLAPDSKEQHRLINELTLRFLQEHL
jgi:dienelactone hydrolase